MVDLYSLIFIPIYASRWPELDTLHLGLAIFDTTRELNTNQRQNYLVKIKGYIILYIPMLRHDSNVTREDKLSPLVKVEHASLDDKN